MGLRLEDKGEMLEPKWKANLDIYRKVDETISITLVIESKTHRIEVVRKGDRSLDTAPSFEIFGYKKYTSFLTKGRMLIFTGNETTFTEPDTLKFHIMIRKSLDDDLSKVDPGPVNRKVTCEELTTESKILISRFFKDSTEALQHLDTSAGQRSLRLKIHLG